MNPMEEITLLKERVAVLERVLLRQPRHMVKNIARDNGEGIAQQAKLFVANQFKLNTDDLSGTCRQMRVVWPRWIAIHLAYKYSGLGQIKIGRVFKRDHGSIAHALEGLKAETEINAFRRQQVLELDTQFQSLCQQAIAA